MGTFKTEQAEKSFLIKVPLAKDYFEALLLADANNVPVQVILFEIDCAIFYSNLHELFCQFISLANWVNSGKFMDNC